MTRIVPKLLPISLILLAGILLGTPHHSRAMNRYSSNPVIRVCLIEQDQYPRFYIDGTATAQSGGQTHTLQANTLYTCSVGPQGAVLLASGGKLVASFKKRFRCFMATANHRFGFKGGQYSDTLEFVFDGKGITVINRLPVRDYLYNVVHNELGRDANRWSFEALKAQAIISRTYALWQMEMPVIRLFDVHDDIRDQVFTGVPSDDQLSIKAVDETRGDVLEYKGRFAECYFHSTCGGKTEAVENVWNTNGAKPYLKLVSDDGKHGVYCKHSPSYRWTVSYTRTDFESILKQYLPVVIPDETKRLALPANWKLLDIKIKKRAPSGRVLELALYLGTPGKFETLELRSDKIRWVIRQPNKEDILRSTLFDLDISRDSKKWISKVTFSGGGSGHGVGMCQWGAIERARQGHAHESILKAYFPGTAIKTLYNN